jgi:hypothetical protein
MLRLGGIRGLQQQRDRSVATMPGWLQPFARNQPFSVTVTAVRALLEGGPAAQYRAAS